MGRHIRHSQNVHEPTQWQIEDLGTPGTLIQAYLGYCITLSNYGLTPGYMGETVCQELTQ
jgi:hypothetical protein